MANLNYWLTKTVRFTGWPLFAAVITYLLTGYAMAGEYGLGSLMAEKQALAVHKILHAPLLVLFTVHSLPAIYLAFWRWGWIRR